MRYTFFMTRLILAPMVLALSPLPATAQVKIHVSPSHHKQYETIHATVENAGSKPITFCIQVGQTSPKGGGETEATPLPFWEQKYNNGKWSTLLIGPDVGNFQHPGVLEPGKSLDFPFRLGESGPMRLRLTYWNGSLPNLACNAPPQGAKVATSAPFAVDSAFPKPTSQPNIVSGRVIAYSVIPACLNGNGYWSMLIRVEEPNNLNSQLIRVDFSLPCGKSPEWISTNTSVKTFRLVRDKNADVVLSGCLQGECEESQSLPIWKRPTGGSHDPLPFGQTLPSYRSIDLPLAPVV
ncbi:MAG TPA: hypothetical protein VJR23_14660 [Candidatus Acidoferrales bacterium]|nr:hypothetical protein [Candidatus Acidoferrales bacterium]